MKIILLKKNEATQPVDQLKHAYSAAAGTTSILFYFIFKKCVPV